MSQNTTTTRFGRVVKQTNYSNEPKLPIFRKNPKSKQCECMNLQNPIPTIAYDYIHNKFNFNMNNNEQILLNIQKIQLYEGTFQIYGQFADKANRTYDTWDFAQNQPIEILLSALSVIIDLDPKKDLSNKLYNKITNSFKITSNNYLKFSVDELVLYKPLQQYQNNKKVPLVPVLFLVRKW